MAEDNQGGPWARTATRADGTIMPPDRWQPLVSHLEAVGHQARDFAEKFGAAEWAFVAGVWHDLGKYHPDFQQMLKDVSLGREKRRVDHSTAGAIHAATLIGGTLRSCLGPGTAEPLELLLTATIAGHHGGLADGIDELQARLEEPEKRALYQGVLDGRPPEDILRPVPKVPALPSRLAIADESERRLRTEMLARMILSTLVDADRLDAERFQDATVVDGAGSTLRTSYARVSLLRAALDAHIDEFVAGLKPERMEAAERLVFDYRQAVLRACRAVADSAPGAFFLDVVTGGGKTLSALSFALRHAERHGKDRVIVVIPFTSIIEQTAAEYRKALGESAGDVLEHHSAVNEGDERARSTGQMDPASDRRRRATENWDPPLIVTTAVQFFESLFASSPSRCRKLHNIARSVVVIDEAQTLPPELLNPTVWAINELVEAYGTTIVLSTATQPALEPPFPQVRNLRPIMPVDIAPPPPRVRVEYLGEGTMEWESLARELAAHRQVLCITHLRDDARRLTRELDRMLGDESALHLSAAMCPTHRSAWLTEIRRLLAGGEQCRVVSTQLVEAGVDLDFPIVYRALAGVDSLVQAAGRANREGRLGTKGGLLRVYRAPTEPPRGLPRLAMKSAALLFESARIGGREVDLFAPATGRVYFRDYYAKVADKDHGITSLRREFRFRTVSDQYRFIRDAELSVVVLWDERARRALEDLHQCGPSRGRLRALQPYTIGMARSALRQLLEIGAVEALLPSDEESEPSSYILRQADLYDGRLGLSVKDLPRPGPEAFLA